MRDIYHRIKGHTVIFFVPQRCQNITLAQAVVYTITLEHITGAVSKGGSMDMCVELTLVYIVIILILAHPQTELNIFITVVLKGQR